MQKMPFIRNAKLVVTPITKKLEETGNLYLLLRFRNGAIGL
jgi:hypothetical protein